MALARSARRTLTAVILQRFVSLCTISLFLLIYFALRNDPGSPHESGYESPGPGINAVAGKRLVSSRTTLGVLQAAFLVYSLIVHLLASAFPIRACLSLRYVTRRIRETKCASQAAILNDANTLKNHFEFVVNPTHAIIIPNYKEDIDTIRDTLRVLASHPLAIHSYHVILAMELAEEGATAKAQHLIAEMSSRFHSMSFTAHPTGLAGESRGKSSNIAWAAKVLCQTHCDKSTDFLPTDIIVTIVDCDSHLSRDHFTLINDMHRQFPDTAQTTIYIPPIVFDRNCDRVPLLVRLADILWCGAGISNLSPYDVIRPPTSVYSLPLTLVERVNGWDAGPYAIGEDLHMYLKCFFKLRGHLTARQLFSPASQCNVHSDGKGFGGWLRSLHARWQQAVRHMWGSLDTGYALGHILKQCTENNVLEENEKEKVTDDNYNSSNLESFLSPSPEIYNEHVSKPLLSRYANLCRLLWEAHFLPVHLITTLVASSIYTYLYPASAIPVEMAWTFWITGYLRACGFILMALLMLFFRDYHNVCVDSRENEMRHAGLVDDSGIDFARSDSWWTLTDFFLFPVAGTLFGSLPALWAQLHHLWTVHLNYTVSMKPMKLRGSGLPD